jgi:hypothetical protein
MRVVFDLAPILLSENGTKCGYATNPFNASYPLFFNYEKIVEWCSN